MRRFINAKFIIGALCLALILGIAALGNFITPHDPLDQDLLSSLQPPRIWTLELRSISAPTISAATSLPAWCRARAYPS
jgi:hypothetical protein